MIEELKRKKFFHQNDELLKKYFFEGKRNEIEKKKAEDILTLINNFSQKVFGKYVNFLYGSVGYLQDYGYYEFAVADRGYFHLQNYGEDVNEAFKAIMIDTLFNHSFTYECNNREKLKLDYFQRFGNMRYFQCLYFAEYSLEYWCKCYDGEIPDDIIDYYEKYLDEVWDTDDVKGNWHFDFEQKLFSFKKDNKVKKRLNNGI